MSKVKLDQIHMKLNFQRRERAVAKSFEELMAENFLNLMKIKYLQIQVSQ